MTTAVASSIGVGRRTIAVSTLGTPGSCGGYLLEACVAGPWFRDLVYRPGRPDRPAFAGHRKLYDGAKGRTHFDIADFAVGSDPTDEDVAEWIEDVEQRFGDIRFSRIYRLPRR